MNNFKLTVLSAENTFYEGECVSLIIPTTQGQYGIQANHRNMISAIVPGMMKFTLPDGSARVAAVSEGIVKVESNEALILVDSAEKPEEIDVNRAKRSAAAAKEAILQKKSMRDYYAAQAQMARAVNRLKVKKYWNINE